MPSARKRNKGRERKAKKAENKRASIDGVWRNLLSGEKQNVGMSIECNHGCSYPIESLSKHHPVSNFMDDLFIQWFEGIDNYYNKGGSMFRDVLQILSDVSPAHTQLLSSDSYREIAIKIMTIIGSNMVIADALVKNIVTGPYLDIARVIVVLEQYNGTGKIINTINNPSATIKMRNLDMRSSSKLRDGLKFFSKRVSCDCIKKFHLDARKRVPKMGNCVGCEKEVEREKLSVCSRCMVTQYCSRKCQVTDRSNHEKYCNSFVLQQKYSELISMADGDEFKLNLLESIMS